MASVVTTIRSPGSSSKVPLSSQGDQRGRVDGAAGEHRSTTSIAPEALAQLTIADRMHENRHAERGGHCKCGTRLGIVEEKIALGAFDENAAKAEVADGTGEFSGAVIAAEGIHGCQSVEPARVIPHKLRKLVIDALDQGGVDFGAGTADEFERRVHDPGRDPGLLNRVQQGLAARQFAVDLAKMLTLRRRRCSAGHRSERRADEVAVEVDDLQIWTARLRARSSGPGAGRTPERAGRQPSSACSEVAKDLSAFETSRPHGVPPAGWTPAT